MKTISKFTISFLSIVIFAISATAQVDEICAEAGHRPSLDSPFAQIPYVFGRITLKGFNPNEKPPDVTVTLIESQQTGNKWTVGKSGNYCFRIRSSGGTLLVEVNGVEAARKPLPAFGATQIREDFEIDATKATQPPPGVISAKFSHPPNPKTVEIYKKINEAETQKETAKVIEYLKEIVQLDAADFLAWAKLGVLYQEKNQFPEADAAFRKSLELKSDYTPAWVNVGMMRVTQKQFPAAIELFKHALTIEPKSARIYQLLGEAYLLDKQGSLGAESLNKAIELDPNGMAECHLQLAHLYQLAKANKLAAKEYKMFLAKVPDYKDKKKLEEFIKKNPE